MSNDDKILEELRQQAGDEISIDEAAFKKVEKLETETEMDLAALGEEAEHVSPTLNIPTKSIEEKMEELGMSKDIAIDMIMMLSDSGYIEEDLSLFGGRFKAKFRTAKITDSKRFVDLFDALEINTQAKGEYYLNLYSLASILIEFNGKKLDDGDITARAKWIEEELPVPIYKTLIEKGNEFHSKIEILNSDEVADFF